MFRRIQTGGRWLLLCRYHSLMSLWFCFCSGNSVSTLISRITTHRPFSVSSLLNKLITWYKIRRSLSEDICRLILFRRQKNQNPIPACWYIGNSSWNTCETDMRCFAWIAIVRSEIPSSHGKSKLTPRDERREKWIWIPFSRVRLYS